MGYTRFRSSVVAKDGFFVGEKGSEYQIVNSSGSVTAPIQSVSAITGITFRATVSALTSSATISLNPTLGDVFTLTPAHTAAINASACIVGQRISIVVTTSGTDSFTLTFGTAFKSTGTLATGVTTAKKFTISFVSDGTNYNEVARTTAM